MNLHNYIAEERHSRVPVRAVLGLALLIIAAQLGWAQPATTGGAPIEFTVEEAVSRGGLISVPMNQGALVTFNTPVKLVHVTNDEIAEVTAITPQQLLIHGKSYGSMQLVVTVDGGQQQAFTVVVDIDLERLRASIEAMVPRAQVQVQPLMDSVVLKGTVPDTESAERIVEVAHIYSNNVINHMRVAGVQQVMLRCTVAEVNRQATRRLGFNGWIAGENFPNMFATSHVGGINPVNIGAAGNAPISGEIPFLTDQEGLPLSAVPTLSLGFPRVQMHVFIQALRENGLLQVLAEPNLVTISGEQANFLAGGELPYPESTEDGIAIAFREYGVRLNFTPVVLGETTIRLRVKPEVSEPDYSTAIMIAGFNVPGLIQRQVETVVECAPGQTFAIGGLLSEKTRATAAKVPALGDIPVLGSLFSSVEYQQSETELVVLVTPELVSPLNPHQFHYVPGADHIAPNDWELFGLGQLEGEGDPGQGTALPNARRENDWPVKPDKLYGKPAALRLRGPIGPAGGQEGT